MEGNIPKGRGAMCILPNLFELWVIEDKWFFYSQVLPLAKKVNWGKVSLHNVLTLQVTKTNVFILRERTQACNTHWVKLAYVWGKILICLFVNKVLNSSSCEPLILALTSGWPWPLTPLPTLSSQCAGEWGEWRTPVICWFIFQSNFLFVHQSSLRCTLKLTDS